MPALNLVVRRQGTTARSHERGTTETMSSYSIGVDLGGTNLRIAALDSDGNLLEKLTLGAEVKRGRDYVIGEMCSAIQAMRTKFSATGDTLRHRHRRPGLHRHGCGHGDGLA